MARRFFDMDRRIVLVIAALLTFTGLATVPGTVAGEWMRQRLLGAAKDALHVQVIVPDTSSHSTSTINTATSTSTSTSTSETVLPSSGAILDGGSEWSQGGVSTSTSTAPSLQGSGAPSPSRGQPQPTGFIAQHTPLRPPIRVPTSTPRPTCSPPSHPPSSKSWIQIFANAPGRSGPSNSCRQVGEVIVGSNGANPQYVFCRRWGDVVGTNQGYNHYWLWTDLDSPAHTHGWISAYYIKGEGNDQANDIYSGRPIPDCVM
jgi:hypothetical protein